MTSQVDIRTAIRASEDDGVKITYKGETGQAWIKDETDELMVTWDSDLSVSKLPDDDVTMIE